MTTGPEFTEVEQPFIDQLVLMGWQHNTGRMDDPASSGRAGLREVLLTDDLRSALRRINLDPEGRPWLDDERITQAINALQRLGSAKLLEANQAATELLLKGTMARWRSQRRVFRRPLMRVAAMMSASRCGPGRCRCSTPPRISWC